MKKNISEVHDFVGQPSYLHITIQQKRNRQPLHIGIIVQFRLVVMINLMIRILYINSFQQFDKVYSIYKMSMSRQNAIEAMYKCENNISTSAVTNYYRRGAYFAIRKRASLCFKIIAITRPISLKINLI